MNKTHTPIKMSDNFDADLELERFIRKHSRRTRRNTAEHFEDLAGEEIIFDCISLQKEVTSLFHYQRA